MPIPSYPVTLYAVGALNEASKEARERLGEAVKLSRLNAGFAKRTQLARDLGLDVSTVAILEGARTGPIADDTVTRITMRLGWDKQRWREILSGVEAAETNSPLRSATDHELMTEIQRRLGQSFRRQIG